MEYHPPPGPASDFDIESMRSSPVLSSPSSVSLVDWASVSDTDEYLDVLQNVSSLGIRSPPPPENDYSSPPSSSVEVLNVSNNVVDDLVDIERPVDAQSNVPSTSTPPDAVPTALPDEGNSAATLAVGATPAIEPRLIDVDTDLDESSSTKVISDKETTAVSSTTTDTVPNPSVATPEIDLDTMSAPRTVDFVPPAPPLPPFKPTPTPSKASSDDPVPLRRGSTLSRVPRTQVSGRRMSYISPFPSSLNSLPKVTSSIPTQPPNDTLAITHSPSPQFAPNVPDWLTLSVQDSLERIAAPMSVPPQAPNPDPLAAPARTASPGDAHPDSERPSSITFFRTSRNSEMCSEIEATEASNTTARNLIGSSLFLSPRGRPVSPPSPTVQSPGAYSTSVPPSPSATPVHARGSLPSISPSASSRWPSPPPEPPLPSIVDWFPGILNAPPQPSRRPPSPSNSDISIGAEGCRFLRGKWRSFEDSDSEFTASPRLQSPPCPIAETPPATPPPNPQRLTRHLSSLWTRSRAKNDGAPGAESANQNPAVRQGKHAKRSNSMDATCSSSPFSFAPPKPTTQPLPATAGPSVTTHRRPPLPPVPKKVPACPIPPRRSNGCVVLPAPPVPTTIAPVPPVPVYPSRAAVPTFVPYPLVRTTSTVATASPPPNWSPSPRPVGRSGCVRWPSYLAGTPRIPVYTPTDCGTPCSLSRPLPSQPLCPPSPFAPARCKYYTPPSMINPKYYFPDGSLLIKVQGAEYKLHRHVFTKEISYFTRVLPPYIPGAAPAVHELANVTKVDFERFLAILYPSDYLAPDLHTVEEWTSVLNVADTLEFTRLRKLAVNKLSEIATPIQRLMIAKSHKMPVDEFIVPAYRALCVDPKDADSQPPFTAEEAQKLGMKTVLGIWKVQGRSKKWIENCGCRTRARGLYSHPPNFGYPPVIPMSYDPWGPLPPQPPPPPPQPTTAPTANNENDICSSCKAEIDDWIMEEFDLDSDLKPRPWPAWCGTSSIRPAHERWEAMSSPSPPPPPPLMSFPPCPRPATPPWANWGSKPGCDYPSPNRTVGVGLHPPKWPEPATVHSAPVVSKACSMDCICRGWGCAGRQTGLGGGAGNGSGSGSSWP